MTIIEISRDDTHLLEVGRTLFMNYFLDLYKNKTPDMLGISVTIQDYLEAILERTKRAFANDNAFHACLGYSGKTPIAFATFGPIDNGAILLIRTLPIDLAFKKHELEIRKHLIHFIQKKFPDSKQIVIMVRKANTRHAMLCRKAGFIKDSSVFNKTEYIIKTYNKKCYNGYSNK